MLLFVPGTDDDPSARAADFAERDWLSRETGLSSGAWTVTVDHVEYRAFIPVCVIKAVPAEVGERFWREVVASVAARAEVVRDEPTVTVVVPEWKGRPLPDEGAARTSWRLRPITDDGLSDETDRKVILTKFGGVTVYRLLARSCGFGAVGAFRR